MKDLEHKGFIGSVEYDEETATLYGKIKFINGLISYESADGTMKGLVTAFNESVNEYLEDCKAMNLKPQQSAKGVFQVRLGSDLHYLANVEASREGVTLNEWVKNAVANYLQKHNQQQHGH